MKQKRRQLPIDYNSVQNQNGYVNYLQINKKPQQYVEQKSHLPLSNKNINVRKSQQSKIYKSNIKQNQIHYIRQSPYSNLPSLPNENNQEINQSNKSQKYYSIQYNQNSNQYTSNQYDSNKYDSNKYDSNRYDQNNSIYQKLRLNSNRKKQFQTQQSQQVNYYSQKHINNDCNRNIIKKQNSSNINQNKSSNISQSRSSNINQNNKKQIINNNNHVNQKPNFNKKQIHQSQYYFTPNHIHQQQQNQFNNYYSLLDKQKSQQLVKKHINDKLDRVCQKINHLSKQKQYKLCPKHKSITKQNNHLQANINNNNKINWNHQNNLKQYSSTKSSSKLCYSNIVYQPNKQISRTPPSNLLTYQQQSQRINNEQKQKDNRIQQRILSPPKPTHTQFLQTRVIEMDKKISLANQKIVKLQQQLLKERQKLIRKQKQWLLRQNQLLQWIDENQIDQQIIEPSLNSPKRIKNQQQINITSNNIILNNKSQYYLLEQQLSLYQQACGNLNNLLNNILNVFKFNQNWLILMNRTLSGELPGTAFRVKQQMNFKKTSFKSLENQCIKKIMQISNIQPKKTNNFIQQKYQNIQTPIISNNQSQVFLLQSYCPPTSQRYQISTKRNSSNIKHSSRKSLLCVSQSKSTTNKKNNQNISTHKKPTYSKQKDKKQFQFVKPQKQLNRSLYNSRKSDYYCDQVFYDKAPTLQQQIHVQYLNTQLSSDELYYLLSLQAVALQKFVSPILLKKQSVQQDQNFQQEESQLLDSST